MLKMDINDRNVYIVNFIDSDSNDELLSLLFSISICSLANFIRSKCGAEKEIYFIIDGVILTYITIHGII